MRHDGWTMAREPLTRTELRGSLAGEVMTGATGDHRRIGDHERSGAPGLGEPGRSRFAGRRPEA